MAAELIRLAVEKGQPVLFVVHRREIVQDIAERIRQMNIPVGVVMPGQPRRDVLVQVASIQTLLRTKLRVAPVLIIWDEAHHYLASQWGQVYERYQAVHVGFTATPQRHDGRPMGDAFDQLVVAAQYSELLRDGHIVPCEVLRPDEPLGIDLAQEPDDAYCRYAKGRRAIVFESSVDRCFATLEKFRERGIDAKAIVDATPKRERDEAIQAFKRGRLQVLVNVYCLTEGVDLPCCDAIILARGCGHTGVYLQIVGRGLRSDVGKESMLLLDLGGASYQHGNPTDDRVYSLGDDNLVSVGLDDDEEGEEHDGPGERREPKVLNVPLVGVQQRAPQDAMWERLSQDVKAGKRTLRSARSAYRHQYGVLPAD
jgi:superfamily II DNA or RNA helicase